MILTRFVGGTQVKLSERCTQVMGSSRHGQIYELNLVQEFFRRLNNLNPTPTFIDIGANTGSYSLLPIANDNINCYAFEPNPVAFDILSENVELNQLMDKVKLFNNGIWSENKMLDLKIPVDKIDSGLSTFGNNPSRFKYDNKAGEFTTHSVECFTLDSFIKENNIDGVDAIKIDTEGAELDILKGGIETLKKYKPLLLMEYDDKNTNQFGYDRSKIVDFLKEIGYTNFEMWQLSDIFIY